MPESIFHIGLIHFLIVSFLLLAAGIATILTKRNAIGVLIGVELVLNAASINFVAFNHYGWPSHEVRVVESAEPGTLLSPRAYRPDEMIRRRGVRATQSDASEYVIGVTDTLTIRIFELMAPNTDFFQTRQVDELGAIRLPLSANGSEAIMVKGLTTTQLEKKIAKILADRGVINHATVSVKVLAGQQRPSATEPGAIAAGSTLPATRPAEASLLGAPPSGSGVGTPVVAMVVQPLIDGQMFAIFIIVLAAAEAAIALAIFLNFYNNFSSIDVERADEMKG